MQRKVLVATVAAAPLLALFSAAQAETQVTSERTTPIATATAANGAPDSINVTTAGSIKLTAAGAAITQNSSHAVVNAGTISTENVNDSTGILILGGQTANVTNSGAINLLETYEAKDADGDGEVDGPIAEGARRFGIRATGPGVVNGFIAHSGTIAIEGNDSAGISLETAIAGALNSSGVISVTGSRNYGIHAGDIGGSVFVTGGVSALGEGSVGVALDGDVGGAVKLQSAINVRGYRYTVRPAFAEDRALIDADDMLQGGSAVRVAGNVAGGVLFDVATVPDTTDANKDGVVDNPDRDGDGVADAAESTSVINVMGSAPAVVIGSNTRATTIGVVGANENAFGVIQRGSVSAIGLYDGVSSTAMQFGGNNGFATNIAGGVVNSGAITSGLGETAPQTREANSTALQFNAGASTPKLLNSGSILASTITEGAHEARGVQIEAGARLNEIYNSGLITATLSGEKGNAVAIRDLSGTLNTIHNTGRITALVTPTDDADDKDDADTNAENEVVTGRGIAVDARANTTGVWLVQQGTPTVPTDTNGDGVVDAIADADGDGVADGAEPWILGDVLFGSGDDRLELYNGNLQGAMSFGAGADGLYIGGGASAIGDLRDSDGRLVVNVANGLLFTTNAETINATSLNIGAGSSLIVTADPANNTATKFVVGQATIGDGAKIGLSLKSFLQEPQRYTVIQAGSLTVGNLDQSLLAQTPYLYVTTASANQAAGEVYLDVRRRTAAEAQLSGSRAAAYDAVYDAVGSNSALSTAFLAKNDRANFLAIYDQMLPDQGEAMFEALEYANQAVSAAITLRPDRAAERYGPDSFWIQEISGLVRREGEGGSLGADAQTFGFVGGYESMGDKGGALGLTLAYMNIEEHDQAARVGENTTASIVQGGIYGRKAMGNLIVSARGGVGYAWFDGERRLISPEDNLDISNNAKWNGLTASASLGASYEVSVGRYFIRPETSLDYVYLNEDERNENGGGSGFDLIVDERKSNRLSGEAALAMGAQFGRDIWWRPEVRVGYRQTISGSIGDTVARFGANGTPFTLVAADDKDGALTLNLALRAGTAMSYLAIEGGAEKRKRSQRYNVRLSGRMMF
ncbi:autotransporter outer membrane beta-barrel domain-containing protein [Caulobacter segnis]|uniref:autotransporter outer membrane beta-barrel domain-containing protein n=1 Tax=Caulobacter segnis TaxID=88688 RepID=UPI002410B0A7|nr:autotransporter outer membrane beta-barrel domain-containing protein [Caulobacter segnis]MDG2519987.1 autotransporter outer membrane beta-barrel domain-containing protein [Caulobacter segnis]